MLRGRPGKEESIWREGGFSASLQPIPSSLLFPCWFFGQEATSPPRAGRSHIGKSISRRLIRRYHCPMSHHHCPMSHHHCPMNHHSSVRLILISLNSIHSCHSLRYRFLHWNFVRYPYQNYQSPSCPNCRCLNCRFPFRFLIRFRCLNSEQEPVRP